MKGCCVWGGGGAAARGSKEVCLWANTSGNVVWS